jgi:hypothetical protein
VAKKTDKKTEVVGNVTVVSWLNTLKPWPLKTLTVTTKFPLKLLNII